MVKSFVKRFGPNVPYSEIRREARLQRRAAMLGIAPRVVRCTQSSIVMENLSEPCLAQKYGEHIDKIPLWIKEDILDMLYALYTIARIEYLDVTPYNFIEKDGIVWIIDFGHAREISPNQDEYLEEIFTSWNLSKWNSDFA